jgi:hypothetical protein
MPAIRSVGKAVFNDVGGGLVAAPIFWYTRGLADAGRWCINFWTDGWNRFGLGVWLKNLFVPMYGQSDTTGRLISFFMRLVEIVARSVVMVFWTVFSAALFVLYAVGPLFVVYELAKSLFIKG